MVCAIAYTRAVRLTLGAVKESRDEGQTGWFSGWWRGRRCCQTGKDLQGLCDFYTYLPGRIVRDTTLARDDLELRANLSRLLVFI